MTKKTLAVVTGTRAEYHLLFPLLKRIQQSERYDLQLYVTGSHLSEQFGCTYKDILNDGIPIYCKIPILCENDTEYDIVNSMSKAITGFNSEFRKKRPDMLCLLGDRYELMSAAIVAMNYRIPISHIHGGETTEGAIDESIRHSITKMSYLHFTSCESYRNRVIQLGEEPDRVFNVGALGIENIKKHKAIPLKELEKQLGIELKSHFAVVTFHPVTLEESEKAKKEFSELLSALNEFPDLQIVFTKSNADSGGLMINQMIDEYTMSNPSKCTAVYSLGVDRYFSALTYADVVIGNSSSGIIEAPSFCVPVVNIGDRQKGRIQAKNTINCEPKKEDIVNSITRSLSKEFKESIKDTESPYGDGNASEKIMKIINMFFEERTINLKKRFYDIPTKVSVG